MSTKLKKMKKAQTLLWPLLVALVAALLDPDGQFIAHLLNQLGLCGVNNYPCFVKYYASSVLVIFLIVPLVIDIFVSRLRTKTSQRFSRLIEEGEDLLTKSRQTHEFKNRQKEWFQLVKEWDIKKMQPYIEKTFGLERLVYYKSSTVDFEELFGGSQPDYDFKRSILVTRIKRAHSLLSKLVDE